VRASIALIAVVDDDPVLVEGVAGLVRALGHHTETFTSASSLIASGISKFDCVVSDVQMPEIGGLSLLYWIRREFPSVPVILITAVMEPSVRDEALRTGATCVLSKPFDANDIERCITSALSHGP
jgi:CheY-like chemotaxis protein